MAYKTGRADGAVSTLQGSCEFSHPTALPHRGLPDDVRASAVAVVRAYLKRWAIELLIKDEKQHLGLGDYRVKRYRAVVRHLHRVDVAYACLTHLALKDAKGHGAQGQKTKKKPLSLPPISQLKSRMRQVLWREAIEDVVKVSHERPVIRRLTRLMAA